LISDILDDIARGDVVSFVKHLRELVESSIRSVENAIYNAVDMIASGVAMVMDDVRDFGRVDRPHHWIWGFVLALVGAVVLAVALYFLFKPR
jgi:hypothetical protein